MQFYVKQLIETIVGKLKVNITLLSCKRDLLFLNKFIIMQQLFSKGFHLNDTLSTLQLIFKPQCFTNL